MCNFRSAVCNWDKLYGEGLIIKNSDVEQRDRRRSMNVVERCLQCD